MNKPAHQTIRTEGGEELVILSRRDLDVLLASLGEAEAEDRMADVIAVETWAAIEAGTTIELPSWLAVPTANGETAVKVIRSRMGLTQPAVASAAGISRDHLADLDRGAKTASAATRQRLAETFGVDARWLDP